MAVAHREPSARATPLNSDCALEQHEEESQSARSDENTWMRRGARSERHGEGRIPLSPPGIFIGTTAEYNDYGNSLQSIKDYKKDP